MAKDNFIFYRQWWDSIRELEPDEQLRSYDAIMQYVFNGIEPTDRLIRAVTSLMRSSIERDRQRYERVCERNRANGKHGGRPKSNKTDKTQPNRQNPLGFETPCNPEPEKRPENIITSTFNDTTEPVNAAEHEFELFRVAYPGTKRGHQAELDNLKRKNPKSWREIIPQLMPALIRLNEWRTRAAAAGQFVPNYKNLATWINQQCWTEELPEIELNQSTVHHNGKPSTSQIDNERRRNEFAQHIIDKIAKRDYPEPDISGNY